MDCYDKPQYIPELANLFLCSTENHIDTVEFMNKLGYILVDEKNQGKYPYFDLFLCTRKDNETTLKTHKYADKSQVIHYLFDLCGCQGYEVFRLAEEGCKGLEGSSRFFYGIWICRNQKLDA